MRTSEVLELARSGQLKRSLLGDRFAAASAAATTARSGEDPTAAAGGAPAGA
jgi:hypothetical protein